MLTGPPHEALRGRADLDRAAASSSPLHPELVGRSAELVELLATWRRACTGHGGMATISGPAGIGKTRLAEEIVAAAGEGGGRSASVKCFETDTPVAWGAVSLLARRLLEMPGAAGITAASDGVLRQLVPSLSPAGPLSAPGAPPEAALRDAVSDLVAAVAEEAPLLVVLDDLHWADPASRALLVGVARRLVEAPVLFVLAYRPEDLSWDARRLFASLEADHTTRALRLRPLACAEVGELLALTVELSDPGAVAEVAEHFQSVSGGNPLFVVELLRMLQEEGVLVPADGRWRLDVDQVPRELPLSRSVQAVMDRRLDRLSDGAAAVAARLSRPGGCSRVEEIRQATGLDEAAFTAAVAELLEHDVVRWDEGGRLGFVHDQLRDVVRRRFAGVAARPRRPRRQRALLSVLAVLALGGAALGTRLLGASPRYGGGTIYLIRGDSVLEVDPTARELVARPPRGWAPRHPHLVGPFQTVFNEDLWFAQFTDDPRAPYAARLLPDGSTRTVARHHKADISLTGVSPDGSLAAIIEQNLRSPRYDLDLLIAPLDGSPRRAARRTAVRDGGGEWSPNGELITFLSHGAQDSVGAMLPNGQVVFAAEFEEAVSASWCGADRLALAARIEGEPRLALLDLRARTVRLLEGAVPVITPVACSPDASALVYVGVRDGRLQVALYDVKSGRERPVELGDGRAYHKVRWVADRPPPVVSRVEMRTATVRVGWGSRLRLTARVRYTDGSLRDERVTWNSDDPNVASVRGDGTVTGNRPGRTVVRAVAGGWRTDSVHVEVEENAPGSIALRDDFARLDTAYWQTVGTPTPLVVMENGAPALFLRGDGQYTDGLILRRPLALPRGGTLELRFRAPMTRSERQRLQVCLEQSELRPGNSAADADTWIREERFCFQYPAAELSRFDPTRGLVAVEPVGTPVSLEGLLPAHGWTHLALTIQPDGTGRVFVDRRHVGDAALRVTVSPRARWRVALYAASVDTRVLVRDLVLWNVPLQN